MYLMIGPYIDSEGRSFLMNEAERQTVVAVSTPCLGFWKERYCYLLGIRLFLAKDKDSAPFDMINLLKPGASVVYVDIAGKDYCLISGWTNRKNRHSKIRFLNLEKHSICKVWSQYLQQIMIMGKLEKPVPMYAIAFPFKYVALPILLEWFTLKDFVQLDSALTNDSLRKVMLSLFVEYSQRISKRFMEFTITLEPRNVNWMLKRHIAASKVVIRQTLLANILLEQELYDFGVLRELSFEMDTELFYRVLQRSKHLERLFVGTINNTHQFISTVIVHNRRLQWCICSAEFSSRERLEIAMHQRVLSRLGNSVVVPLIFQTLLWYLEPPTVLNIGWETNIGNL